MFGQTTSTPARHTLPHDPFRSSPDRDSPLADDFLPSPTRFPLFSPVPVPEELSNNTLIKIFVRHSAAQKHFIDGINGIKALYTRTYTQLIDLLPKEPTDPNPTITAIKQQIHFEDPSGAAFYLFAKPFLGYGVTGPIDEKEIPHEGLSELLDLQVKIFKFALTRFTTEDPRAELLTFCAHYTDRSTFPLLPIQAFISRFETYGKIVEFFFGDDTTTYGSPISPGLRHFTPIEHPLRSFSVFERSTPVDSPDKRIQEVLAPALAEIAQLWSSYFSKDALTKLFLEVTK